MELHLAAHMELLLLLFGLLEFLPVDSQAQWQVWYYFVQTISKVNYHWDRILLLIVRVILLFLLGTYAGQYAMQGFLNLNWAPWKILVITRSYVYMFILIHLIIYFESTDAFVKVSSILKYILQGDISPPYPTSSSSYFWVLLTILVVH